MTGKTIKIPWLQNLAAGNWGMLAGDGCEAAEQGTHHARTVFSPSEKSS